jgi:hypothetical protein
MPQNLIASLKSPSGNYSAKVYQQPGQDAFRSVFYVKGVKQDDADAHTDSWTEAMEMTAWSLNLSDDMQKQAQASSPQH